MADFIRESKNMIKKHRILQELWVCSIGGYAGIPQDTRTIFQVLSECSSVQLEGLLYLSRIPFPFRKKFTKNWNTEHFFNELNKQSYDLKPINKFEKFIYRSLRFMELINIFLQNQFDLSLLNSKSNGEAIWKSSFAKTIHEKNQDLILNQKFYYSDISSRDILFSAHYGRKIYLNTTEYDFALFPDVRAVNVSPNTKKIVRYHDSFAFLCPDFFQTNHSKMHLSSLKSCVADGSYFACNSENTRETLLTVFPEIGNKAHVVPLAIQPYSKKLDVKKLTEICLTHLSTQICPEKNLQGIKTFLKEESSFEYILSLSTLEPRKNYIGLIRAWEKLNYFNKKNIKLMIVANKGWLSNDIEEVMLPHIKLGNIIHLSGVSVSDVPYLYSHAKLFAYLSFHEGFGIPPLEAMHCQCPVLASDNPTHRGSMGDAAYYVNPYDIDEIANGMNKLIYHIDADKISSQFVLKGKEIIKQYSIESVQKAWAELFDRLR